ncbi:MAG: hypothetical protein MK188_08685 [Gammaproteobacteria bacterium]|nr:hypothetical protein [Gammaproteobacteria bacterium]
MVIEIAGSAKVFNLTESRALVPLVKKITLEHHRALQPIQYRLDRMLSNDPRRAVIERGFEREVGAWQGKIHRLGLVTVGLWEVEFSVGAEGALSWRYPELELSCFRETGSMVRNKLNDYIEEYDPDWALT